jgi:hypothetical protein
MKSRCGHVTNSSSSSFIIQLKDLSATQLIAIQNHVEMAELFIKNNPEKYYGDLGSPYRISVDFENGVITGETSMDNFDMVELMKDINVPDEVIEWDC